MLSDRIAPCVIKGSAFLAIVSLILIFIFIGKEALPVLTSAEVQQEASLSKLFLAQQAARGGGGRVQLAADFGDAQVFLASAFCRHAESDDYRRPDRHSAGGCGRPLHLGIRSLLGARSHQALH